MEQRPGMEAMMAEAAGAPVIGKEQIDKALSMLEKYKDGKAALDERIQRNEEWYRLRHWGAEVGHSKNPYDPEPASAWLFNCLSNKHADAMDNYPEPSVLPRESADKTDAEILSEVLPTLLEQIDYEGVYSTKWWRKIKGGTGCTAVVWDPRAMNGLGEVSVKPIDVLSVFWEPGVNDIQDGANFFRVDVADNAALEEEYPQMKGKLGGKDITTVEYLHDDTIDTRDKTAVVDWYYKRRTQSGKTVVHYCKFAAGEVLYASENDPMRAETGYYEHGQYPFVMDVLFPIEDSPAGFGYLDVCKDSQMFIDKLNQVMLRNAMLSRARVISRVDGGINEEEFTDWTKDVVHYSGSGSPKDGLMWIDQPALPGFVMDLTTYKVNELKETSGNTDFGQGVSSAGVTAASAIAALQEAGGKLSRDMLKASYRAFTEECYLIIELIRQFYDVERTFRIVGEDGAQKFVAYSNANIRPQPQGMEYGVQLGERKPVFDIKVRVYKANTFSRLSQNEMAKEFYSAGFFNPQLADQALACLSMMDFEGKDDVEKRIEKNGTLMQMVQQQQQQIAMLMTLLPPETQAQLQQAMGGGASAAQGGSAAAQPGAMRSERLTSAERVRKGTQDSTNPA
ncbi:MAG: hypothetical protein IKS52_04575 [Clostridia bacterium]|nr:hypothetical protein [Clostridia bacterium]